MPKRTKKKPSSARPSAVATRTETRQMSEQALRLHDRKRMTLVGGCLLMGFLATTVSQADKQVFSRKEIINKAIEAKRYETERTEEARRGTIFSADGRVLAESQDVYELGLFYTRLPKSPAFFAALAEASGKSIDEISRPALTGSKSRLWRDPISADQARRVRQVMREWRADGISLAPVLRRAYPLGEAGAGLLGFVRDGEAVTGLEYSQDKPLAGTDGRAKGFVDRSGIFMPIKGKDIAELDNGRDIALTIDFEIQTEATMALKHAVDRNNATSGAAIVMDPATGDILAMANWPSYDPTGKLKPGDDLNATYMSVFEPGSTFKILTLAKALDEGKTTQTSEMDCPGYITVQGRTLKCAHGAHGHIDWEKAIAESCNVAASRWALDMGRDSMIEMIQGLGLLERPGLGLPGELAGRYNFNDYTKNLQLANNGFGQAMNATPVALASAFSVFGNHGVRMKPRLITRIGEEEIAPQKVGQVFTPETSEYVLKMMTSTIEKDFGTGKGLRIPGYQMAGKTGTAQKLAGGGQKGYVSNFVGFVPAQNPKAVILVMINDPKAGSYYGGTVAGPVFTDLAKAVIRRYGIPPQVDSVVENDSALGR